MSKCLGIAFGVLVFYGYMIYDVGFLDATAGVACIAMMTVFVGSLAMEATLCKSCDRENAKRVQRLLDETNDLRRELDECRRKLRRYE